MSENSTFQEIRQLNRDLASTVQKEKSGEVAWGRYGLGEREYSNTFRIVSDESIGQMLTERRSAGKKNLVCDLMSGTAFLESLGDKIDGGIAVGLGDGRDTLEQLKDVAKGIDMVEGNLISKKTWSELRNAFERMKSRFIPQSEGENTDGFNMITCRPLGGIYTLTDDANIHFWLLQNAYSMLSRDNGVLLTQLPYPTDGGIPKGVEIVKEWIHELKETNPALQITFGQSENGRSFALKMVKTQECPNELPPLQRLAKQQSITEELKTLKAA